MRRLLAISFLAAAACGGAPKPAPAAAELEVAGPASFAGTWVSADDLDFGYRLVLAPDGGYLLTIDRGKMGTCEQKGGLRAGDSPRTYQLAYAKDTCASEPGTGPAAVTFEVASYTGAGLTVALTADGTPLRRTYQRDPNVPMAAPAP